MTEIDKPFRVTWSFAFIWAGLAAAVGGLVFRRHEGWWIEKLALTLLGSLYAAFCLYGPIVLARQVKRSGGRGWHVLRVLLLIVIGFTFLVGGLEIVGCHAASGELAFVLTFFVFANLNEWVGNNRRT